MSTRELTEIGPWFAEAEEEETSDTQVETGGEESKAGRDKEPAPGRKIGD